MNRFPGFPRFSGHNFSDVHCRPLECLRKLYLCRLFSVIVQEHKLAFVPIHFPQLHQRWRLPFRLRQPRPFRQDFA
jgi:hypothetical protein